MNIFKKIFLNSQTGELSEYKEGSFIFGIIVTLLVIGLSCFIWVEIGKIWLALSVIPAAIIAWLPYILLVIVEFRRQSNRG
jgi:hypothetical protein